MKNSNLKVHKDYDENKDANSVITIKEAFDALKLMQVAGNGKK